MKMPLKTIRSKLMVLIFLTIFVGQTVAAGLSLWQEATRYGAQKREILLAKAHVLAAQSAPFLAKSDRSGIYSALKATARMDGITYVGLKASNGNIVAELGATERLTGDLSISADTETPSPFDLVRSRSIEVVVPVVQGGTKLGALNLIADTSDLASRLWSALSFTAIGGLIGLAVAIALVARLQRIITEPLRALTSTMAKIKDSHDYSVAMPSGREDEVGILNAGFNAMIDDIHARDQQLARHLEQLEQEVADRTQDFRNAAAEADAANRAKSEFLATMSHEIRTPMNGILVMAELLANYDLPQKARRQAEVIAKSGQNLLAIINDILDFSKIEAGRLEVETLEVEPAEACESVLRLFADRARSKSLDLAARIELGSGAMVAADPVRLGQVLSNLVNNALKFTEKGAVTLVVAPDPDQRDHIKFAVEDTGIGIAVDKLGTIFESFSQADQTTTRRFGGTGLGLTIGKKLVAAMGGDLAVSSTLGKGSSFHFSLPMMKAGQSVEPVANAPKPLALVCLPGPASSNSAIYYLQALGFEARACSAADLVAEPAKLVLASPETLRAAKRSAQSTFVIVIADASEAVDSLLRDQTAHAALNYPLARDELTDIAHAILTGRPVSVERAAPTIHLPTFNGARILVADDSAVNLEVAQEALARLGATLILAKNGLEALSAAKAGGIDLILMDGSMPEMDGFESARAIRAHEVATHAARLPIIALTAHVVGTAADEWRAAGMDGILHKPYSLAKLAACLSHHLGANTAAEDARMPESNDIVSLLNPAALDGLREMSGGSNHLVERVSRLYQVNAPQRIAEMRAALELADFGAIAAAAHALKSMSLNIGAQAVGQVAATIEGDALAAKPTLDQTIKTLDALTEQTCLLLNVA